ncbi:hypothetical protein [Lysobacter sp. A3-1-A15]|uniref:hypothetical protein n=1 Tax=Novilysobacter viscosus TaxID=3098602 RepID=UPI002EDB4EE2
MIKFLSSFGFVLAACLAFPAQAEKALYINFAPDVRYSENGQDSRISFETEKGLYSLGHDYGKLVQCADASRNCIAFDFMALLELPEDAAVGAEYAVGSYRFHVTRKVDLPISGCQRQAFRVDVTKDGKRSNSYLINAELGVVAIITPNFSNKEIPESIFFLHGRSGLFGKDANE